MAHELGRRIDALLPFARLSRHPSNNQPAAPADLVRKVLQELTGDMEDRNLNVNIAELPSCQADPAMLKQVLVNLLSNAIKYTRTRHVVHIEVGSQALNGQQVYFIKDNGVG